MKSSMIVVLAAVLLLGTGSQVAAMGGVEAGVKGGVNFANQSTDPDDAGLENSRTGLALGGYVGIPVLPSVKIQPEALFMMKGLGEGTAWVDIPGLFTPLATLGLIIVLWRAWSGQGQMKLPEIEKPGNK